MSEDRDGFLNAQTSDRKRLIQPIHAKPIRTLGHDRSNDVQTVSIRVRLNNDHHGSARGGHVPQCIDICPEARRVDFNPRKHHVSLEGGTLAPCRPLWNFATRPTVLTAVLSLRMFLLPSRRAKPSYFSAGVVRVKQLR